MGDRLFNWMLLACVVTLCLAAASIAGAESTISEQAAVCAEWREITSPWGGYTCFEKSGFPVCVPKNATSWVEECKAP